MDAEENNQLKILVVYPNQTLGDIYVDNLPTAWDHITINNRNYRILEHHESTVQRGTHKVFPNSHWDHIIVLA